MEAWERYLKKENNKNRENYFFRNFGTLSNDSVATDIYKKRINNRRKGKYGKIRSCKNKV